MKKIVTLICFITCSLFGMQEQEKKIALLNISLSLRKKEKKPDIYDNPAVKVVYRNPKLANPSNSISSNTLHPIAELDKNSSKFKPSLIRMLQSVRFIVPTAKFIICAYDNGVIEFLDPENQRVITAFVTIAKSRFLALSKDTKYLVITGDDKTEYAKIIYIYNLTDLQNCVLVKELAEHIQDITYAQIVSLATLITAAKDKTIKLWNLSDPLNKSSLCTLGDHSFSPSGLLVTNDGKSLISGSLIDGIFIWDIQEPEHSKHVSSIQVGAYNARLTFIKNNKQLCLLEGTGRIFIYSLEKQQNPERVEQFTYDINCRFYSMIVSSDARYIIGGANNGEIYIWDLDYQSSSGIRLIEILNTEDTSCRITSLFLSADGTLFAGTNDGMVFGWNLANPHKPEFIGKFQAFYSLASNSDNAIMQITLLKKKVLMTQGCGVAQLWQLP